jgi:protein O-mannosyl-transferase
MVATAPRPRLASSAMRKPPRHARTGPRSSSPGPAAPPQPTLAGGSSLPGLLLAAAVLVAATLAAYWAALGHDFVGLDDMQYVAENPAVLAKHYGELLRAVVLGNYHPLTMITMAWNVTTPLSALPFIVTNLALHVANTLLVFWLAWLLSGRRLMVAAFVGLLFGIHPMHVQSVAWISERKDVLYTFFFLAGLIAYWRYLLRRQWPLLALTFVLFLLSCLAKGMAIVFPLVMVLLDYWSRRPLLERRAVLEKLPFLATSVLFGLIALDVQHGGEFHGAFHAIGYRTDALAIPYTLSPLQKLVLPTWACMTYIARVFVPLNLCALDPYPSPVEMRQPGFFLAPLGFLAMLALMIWDARRTRVLTFGLGWFLATVVLVLQWVPVGGAIVADRYSYLSYVGLFFILGMALQAVFERRRALGVALWSAGGLFAVFLHLLAIPQVAMWKDADAVWSGILRQHPDLIMCYVVRGMKRLETGRTQDGLSDFRIAYARGLRGAEVYDGLGMAYGRLGQFDSSLVMLDRGVAISPPDGELYYNRAATYQAMGRQHEAVADMDHAIALAPATAPKIYGARGYSKMLLGDHRGAIADFDLAVAAGRGNADVFFYRGSCRLRIGDREGAAQDFRATLRLAPGDERAVAQLRTLGL